MIVSHLVNLMVERLYSSVVMQIWLAMLYCFKIISLTVATFTTSQVSGINYRAWNVLVISPYKVA
jgi:hypothetical protein